MKSETKQTIDEIIKVLKTTSLDKKTLFQSVKDLYSLLIVYLEENTSDACRYFTNILIPFLQKVLMVETNEERSQKYYEMYKNSHGFAARRSLEHFILYYEWDWEQKDKLLENRYEILMPFVYYLNKMTFDENLQYVLASYMPSAGKCVKSTSYLLTPDGRKMAKDLNIGDYVYSESSNRLCKQKIINRWESSKPQVKITTKSGKEIIISPEHKMLTLDGYKKAKEITTKDYLKLLLKPINGSSKIDDNELIFITCMLFEGHCKKHKLSYTGEDNEITQVFLQSCKNLGIKYKKYTKKNNKASSYQLFHYPAYEILEKYGLNNHLSYTKRMPKQFWDLSLEQKNKIISIMFATDGYITKRDIGITLANEELINDIQIFLNTIGIFSTKSFKKVKEYNSWRLRIPKDFFLKLKKDCYFYQKQENANNICENQVFDRGNLSIKYPYKYFENLKSKSNDYNKFHFERKTDKTERTFNKMVKNYPELEEYRYKDFVWEEIKNIEYLDEKEDMIDFEIENTHNFLLEGYVSHNSRVTCYYEAWRLGVQSGGCFLRISYSDLLAKGFSRSVIDIIKSEEYAFVFPHLNYKKNKKKLFTKETDEEWRLSTAKLLQSYMARSRDGQINGTRASLSIDIDDMLKDDKEALNMDLHKDIWIKWVNVIQSRRTLGKKIGYVIVGTKWSPYDLICRVSQDLKETHDFKDDPKFKYTEIAKDGTAVIINVPALDYETDESTCPKVISTEELHEIRRKNTPYYFQSVYQQNPIPPEGLDFAYEALNTYDVVPRMGNPREEGRYDYTLASLDPARKGKNYVSMPIHCRMGELYPLVDVLFEKKAMSDLYEDIVAKIIQHKVIRLVLENNIDTSLKKILDDMLHERGYYSCEIIEHYSLGKKEDRIRDQQGVIRNQIVFPRKGLFPVNTPMGKFMEQLTTFSFDFPNKYDDAIDSEAMFAHQIILDRASGQKAQVLSRRKLGL